MRFLGFKRIRSMSKVLGVCLCLVLVSLVTAGAIAYTQQSYTGVCSAAPLQPDDAAYIPSAAGSAGPSIPSFKGKPTELATADAFVVYSFVVRRASGVQIIEAGNKIRDISNPTMATLKGEVNGLPASAIKPDASGKFTTVLIATSNEGSAQAELTLSLAADLLPEGGPAGQAGATDNQTKSRTPDWGEQYSTPRTLTFFATPNRPNFFKCPNNCNYCLKPEEAAAKGFTNRCSAERCYYSPDNQQSWYCYSEPEGWCCANQQVSQTTRSRCTQIGGVWSTNQYEAIAACQPRGYCCFNGNVYGPLTKDECALKGGSYWSTNQYEVMQRCAPPACWCCAKGQVFETTQDRCYQAGGSCYSTQSQAAAACRQTTPRITAPY